MHALGQVVHFYTASRHPPEIFVRALNALLPRDLRVLDAREMPQAFHATLDAKSKRYRYVIDNGPIASPFQLRYSWHVLPPARRRGHGPRRRRALLGRHDFHSFETEWPNRTSSVRTILDLAVNRSDDLVWIEVEADGFLYNMVRAIAGTLVLGGVGQAARIVGRRSAAGGEPRRGGADRAPARVVSGARFASGRSALNRPDERSAASIGSRQSRELDHAHRPRDHPADHRRGPGEHAADRRGSASPTITTT